MTIRETLENRLFQNGMFRNDAAAVMDAVIAAPENESMQGRWDESIDGYPPQLLAVLWLSVKSHALHWIDKNQPKALYRSIFAGDDTS